MRHGWRICPHNPQNAIGLRLVEPRMAGRSPVISAFLGALVAAALLKPLRTLGGWAVLPFIVASSQLRFHRKKMYWYQDFFSLFPFAMFLKYVGGVVDISLAAWAAVTVQDFFLLFRVWMFPSK